jgi:tetratricopeptide (TPR) repeat protein
VALIDRYRKGNDDVKRDVMKELNKLGSPGHAILIKLAGAEKEANLRRDLFDLLTGDVLPGLLAAGRNDEVEELLELGLKDGKEQALRHFAAFLLFQGRLKSRIPVWTKKARKLTGYKEAEVLMYLHRANGDLKSARKAARKTDKKWLLASILIEMSDWKELSAHHTAPYENPQTLEGLGYSTAYYRLAGDTKAFDKGVAALLDNGKKGTNSVLVRLAAQALLFNDRPREAIELLTKSNNPAFAVELLTTQQRYREAFALAGKSKDNPDPMEQFKLALALARAHAAVGDREQAGKVLDKLAAASRNPKDATRSLQVIEAEAELGLLDQAFTHAARVVTQAQKEDLLADLLGYLFPDRGRAAAGWWKFFRQKEGDEGLSDTLGRLRKLFTLKAKAKEVTDLAQEMAKAAGTLAQKEETADWLRAAGDLCADYGQDGPARDYLARAGSAGALTRLGDLLARKKLWKEAAERYEQAWKKDRNKALPLYLRGWVLEKAGKKDEAAKALVLARTTLLANDAARFKLSQDLARRGLVDLAGSEWELLTRVGRLNGLELSNAQRLLGLAAYRKKKFQAASDYYDRMMLVCFGSVYFVRATPYLTIPGTDHHLRARAFLAAGKVPEAVKETNLLLTFLPGDLDGTLHVIPALDKAGRKKDADALFKRSLDHYEQLCKAYPKSVQHQNSLAWLAACCRRQLDKALEHAKKAVALAPKNAGVLDTLAEVYYQKGDKAQAIKLMKKCLELDPKKNYYHKQIKRFQAPGPPSATPVDG